MPTDGPAALPSQDRNPNLRFQFAKGAGMEANQGPSGVAVTRPHASTREHIPTRPRRRFADQAFRAFTLTFALFVLLFTPLIGTVLWWRSAQARATFGASFLWTSAWDPVFDKFGSLPFVYGTLLSSALALAMALPLGLGAAICLSELLPRRTSDLLSFLVE